MLSPAIPRRCGQQLLDSESTRIRTGFFANERDNRHHKNVAGPTPRNAECETHFIRTVPDCSCFIWNITRLSD